MHDSMSAYNPKESMPNAVYPQRPTYFLSYRILIKIIYPMSVNMDTASLTPYNNTNFSLFPSGVSELLPYMISYSPGTTRIVFVDVSKNSKA